MEWRYYYTTEHENFSFLYWTFTRLPHKGNWALNMRRGERIE
jgi:hypothetical protein